MTNKYYVGRNGNDGVFISLHTSTDGYLDSFLDVWVDDGEINSPFENIEDAELFAQILVKLLNKVGETSDIE